MICLFFSEFCLLSFSIRSNIVNVGAQSRNHFKEVAPMVITILLGAMAAVFIAFNLFEKKETYGVISYKSIALSITYVILAVIVGSFLEYIYTIFQGFQNNLTAEKRY